MIKALILDLDGVITDTARFHFLAWKRLADELGYHFTEKDNERLKGVDRMTSLEILLEVNNACDRFTCEEKAELATKKNEYYKAYIETMTPSDILPGIEKLIEDAKKEGILLAVASASKNAPVVLRRIGLLDAFDYIADAARVTKQKPDPEIFYVCADALGVKPGECLGIEDAQAGIQAIHGAGMKSVGIHVDVTCLAPDIVLQSTSELNLYTLLKQSF